MIRMNETSAFSSANLKILVSNWAAPFLDYHMVLLVGNPMAGTYEASSRDSRVRWSEMPLFSLSVREEMCSQC
jgi:hypothetical protein